MVFLIPRDCNPKTKKGIKATKAVDRFSIPKPLEIASKAKLPQFSDFRYYKDENIMRIGKKISKIKG